MIWVLIFLAGLVISIVKMAELHKRRKNGERVSLVGPIIGIAVFGVLLALALFLWFLTYQIMRSM